MMKNTRSSIKRIIIPFIVLMVMYSCTNNEDLLIYAPEYGKDIREVETLNELIGSEPTEITINPASNHLLGKIQQVIKYDSCYYFLTRNTIVVYNNSGLCIDILSKIGHGPGEYVEISNFEVRKNSCHKLEIWIASMDGIKVYTRKNEWEMTKKIDYGTHVHRFTFISDRELLLMTGQSDKSLKVGTVDGEIILETLQSEVPYLMLKPHQFVHGNGKILFFLGNTDHYIEYNPKNRIFSEGIFSHNSNVISTEELLSLYQQHQVDYIRFLSKYCCNKSIRIVDDLILRYDIEKHNRYYSILDHGITRRLCFSNNDEYQPPSFFHTISSDSFLFIEYPTDNTTPYKLIDY